MAVVRNLMIRAGADFSGISRETRRAQRTLAEFRSSTQATMSAIKGALVALGIGKVIKDSVNSAMGVEASIQQINRLMGENSAVFQKWANDQALAFNMSKAEAIKYGAVYGNLVSGFTKSTAETMNDTQDLLKASSIIMSATGRDMEDVMDRIRSGLLGNTEAIEDLGVNVNVAMIESTDAFKKFANGKSWEKLNFQTQQQIRLMAILEQTTKKYGDSVFDNTASRQAQFIAQLKNIQLNLGQAFLPIYNVVLPILTNFANKLAYVTSIASQFSQALFGKDQKAQSQATSKQASAVGGLGDAYKEAGKKAKGALAGFDEINSLSDNTGSDSGESTNGAGSGAGSGNNPGEPNAPEISPQIQAAADTIKNQMASIKDTISKNKAIITSALGGILAAFVALKAIPFLAALPTVFAGIGTAVSGLLAPVAIAAAVIGSLVAAFLYLYQTNERFRDQINEVWSDIAKTLKDFYQNTLKPIGDYFMNDFLGPIASALKNSILPVLADIFVGASLILHDLLKLVISIFDNIWQAIKPAMDLIKTIIVDVLGVIKDLWDKHGQDIINNVRNLIKGLQDTFQLIWTNVINPIIQPALEMLSSLWTEHLSGLVAQVGDFVMKLINGALEIYNGFIKPLMDWFIVNLGPTIASVISGAIDVFGGFLGVVSDVVKGVFKVLGGLIDFIVGVFTGNWQKAWEGVRDIFGGIFDTLYSLVKVPLNLIIDAINVLIRGINGIRIAVPDWVPGFGGKSWTPIPINEITPLAKGGITNGPMAALIGDNPGGREVVSPLDDLRDMIASAVSTAMVNAMQFTRNQGGDQAANFYLDGAVFARAITPLLEKESGRTGKMAISMG